MCYFPGSIDRFSVSSYCLLTVPEKVNFEFLVRQPVMLHRFGVGRLEFGCIKTDWVSTVYVLLCSLSL